MIIGGLAAPGLYGLGAEGRAHRGLDASGAIYIRV